MKFHSIENWKLLKTSRLNDDISKPLVKLIYDVQNGLDEENSGGRRMTEWIRANLYV